MKVEEHEENESTSSDKNEFFKMMKNIKKICILKKVNNNNLIFLFNFFK